jgi:mannose-6-phosphate isomerase-like protein (cupin superfamily)
MGQVHLFNINTIDWTDHPRFAGLQIKGLEGRDTHPHLSFMLVRVATGGVIPRHVHEQETETVYVVSGRGELRLGVEENGRFGEAVVMQPGSGASVPPGLYHSVQNTSDAPLEILAIHSPPVR